VSQVSDYSTKQPSAPSPAPSTPSGLNPSNIPWFVLFFDLVVVAAFSQTAKMYQANPTWEISVFVAGCILLVYSIWAVTTIESLVSTVETWTHRIIGFVQMAAIVVGALALGHGKGLQDAWGFAALSVALGCSAVLTGLHRNAWGTIKSHTRRRVILLTLASVIFFAGTWISPNLTLGGVEFLIFVFFLGTAVTIAGALTLIPQLVDSSSRVRSHVIQERFGLILLIVLGDSFLLLLASVGTDKAVPQPLFFMASILIVFAIWAMYFPSLADTEISTKLGRSYARLGAHFLLVLSSTVGIVACTWMAKTSTADLLLVSDEGTWTALPLSSVALSILWMTLLRDRRMSAPAVVHLVSFVVIFSLAMLGIPADNAQSYWLLLAAVGTLCLEALLAVLLTPKAAARPQQ
jgi:low temperature requirement protein LtrA